MFCTNCGKEIADGVKFCPHCGTEVSNEPVNDELAATLTVDGGNYAATADDSNMRMPISRIIIIILGLVVVAAGVIATTAIYNNYQDYKNELDFNKWVYNSVTSEIDKKCQYENFFEEFDNDWVTRKEEAEYHDFGEGNIKYMHLEVMAHFTDEDRLFESFPDGVKIHAYYHPAGEGSVKPYLYIKDVSDQIALDYLNLPSDGGTGNVTTEPTASPEPEPTEKSMTEEETPDNVLIPKGTWPGPTDITMSVVEALGLSSDDDPKLQEIYDWCCKEVTNHYAESLPADCKHAFPWYFYPREFQDWEYKGENHTLCFLNVYVPMNADVVQEGTPFADTIDNYFEINISYCKDFDLLKVTCPAVESGDKACDVMDGVEKAWNSKHQSK